MCVHLIKPMLIVNQLQNMLDGWWIINMQLLDHNVSKEIPRLGTVHLYMCFPTLSFTKNANGWPGMEGKGSTLLKSVRSDYGSLPEWKVLGIIVVFASGISLDKLTNNVALWLYLAGNRVIQPLCLLDWRSLLVESFFRCYSQRRIYHLYWLVQGHSEKYKTNKWHTLSQMVILYSPPCRIAEY